LEKQRLAVYYHFRACFTALRRQAHMCCSSWQRHFCRTMKARQAFGMLTQFTLFITLNVLKPDARSCALYIVHILTALNVLLMCTNHRLHTHLQVCMHCILRSIYVHINLKHPTN
jgi:hypothetical protein